ncbi:MAG: hypothetical protein RO009_24070 [Pseudorhodoplanes sp.]|jgi:hypothetical protein|nr:hypothetical protein [Pseudorhodoplanes sp.]
MKKVFIALVAAVTLTGSVIALSSEAEASKSGRALTYGILGGVAAGALIAGAASAAPPPPPAYYAPAPTYYYDEPVCRIRRERFWDGYAWRTRRVEVCH